MNSFDLYEFEFNKPPTPVPRRDKPDEALSSTATDAVTPSEPTLNDEVNQAFGQLSKFWGGFRASSQSAFQLARKDIGQVVEQARAEIGKITSDASVGRSPPTSPSHTASAPDVGDSDVKDKGKGKDPSEFPTSSETNQPTPESPSISTSIYARLQSSMPQNLQPSAIAATLSSATSSVDLTNIRSTLTANIQRAQDNLPLAQAEKLAEGYLHKSQELFKEAGEFLKDAVKVVPPSLGPDGKPITDETIPIVSGTDVWLFPSPIGTTGWGGPTTGEREASVAPPLKESRASMSSLRSRESLFTGHMSQATRSETLLRRLKYDPEMIRLDPTQDDAVKAEFVTFAEDVNNKLGGISGDTMVGRVSDVLKAGPGGELDADAKALIDNRDLLVPTEMSNDVFWTRYFFRVQQITNEEEKRKALLANVSQQEELFSWEEDDEEPPAAVPRPSSAADTITISGPAPSSAGPPEPTPLPPRIPSNPTLQSIASVASSRLSSEDGSYDIVGEESAAGTGGQSPFLASEVSNPASTKEQGKGDPGDSDSDWE